MATPIQIIPNPKDFERVRGKGRVGPGKDFFEGEDDEFILHMERICNQLSEIADILDDQETGGIGILKVILRGRALAKGHRPVQALFKPDFISIVGGGDLGEIFVEVHPAALRRIRNVSEEAGKKENNAYLGTGAVRSEIGAIERIELYGSSDRRRFSVADAVDCLLNPVTGGSYYINLFNIPLSHGKQGEVDRRRRILHKTFIDGIQMLGKGIVVAPLTIARGDQKTVSLRIEKSSNASIILPQSQSPMEIRRSDGEVAPFDPDIERHKRVLAFLDNHPLVRRVELPPTITHGRIGGSSFFNLETDAARSRPKNVGFPEPESSNDYPKIGIMDGDK